jgi:hypothetical protein
MANCEYVLENGTRCWDWVSRDCEYCLKHDVMVSRAIETYYNILRWCEQRYRGR